jgi:uncharacterized membrane protein (Fun14 family)
MPHRRVLSRSLARERMQELEYGLKEMFQGNIVGFIIGFLLATQVAVPSLTILSVLLLFAISLAVVDALRIPGGETGGRKMISSKEEEVEYGLKEFLLGILVGFLLGLIIATQIA